MSDENHDDDAIRYLWQLGDERKEYNAKLLKAAEPDLVRSVFGGVDIPAIPWWKLPLVKLFGRKVVSHDADTGTETTAYWFRGVSYITQQRWKYVNGGVLVFRRHRGSDYKWEGSHDG